MPQKEKQFAIPVISPVAKPVSYYLGKDLRDKLVFN